MTVAELYQINVSNGGVPKRAVHEARVTKEGLDGDRQRNRGVHGGPDRAVCLFSLEVIQALQAEGHDVQPGSTGENLTVAGVDWPKLTVGDLVRVGEEVLLEITSYTAPCERNARWFADGDYNRISEKHFPGSSRLYARVLGEGIVRKGDRVVIVERGERQ